jgi:hypothetical protein
MTWLSFSGIEVMLELSMLISFSSPISGGTAMTTRKEAFLRHSNLLWRRNGY